jgi:hypothetical protein
MSDPQDDGLFKRSPLPSSWSLVPIDAAGRDALITAHVVAIKALHRNTTREKLQIGWHLNEIKRLKAEVPHGHFMQWVGRNFIFGIKTAERYMNAARAFEGKFDIVSNLPITETALYALGGRDVPARAIDVAIAHAETGQGINEDWAKSIIFEARRHERIEAGKADPFMGLSDEDVARVTQSLGFFRDADDNLRRSKSDPIPPHDILTWISTLMRAVKKVHDREAHRRREHKIYLGAEERDLAYAELTWSELTDVIVDVFSRAAHLDMLGKTIERAKARDED